MRRRVVGFLPPALFLIPLSLAASTGGSDGVWSAEDPGSTRLVVGTVAPEAGLLLVPATDARIVVDGVLAEEEWGRALVIPVETEVRPGENIAAPVTTRVLLTYGPDRLYVAFEAYDPEPGRIRARFSDRDEIFDDDWVAVVFDTFNDARRSYEFFCNPLGVQADMVETTGSGEDLAWDAIWDSAGRIVESGYSVEMAIPFSSLRFQKGAGEQIWGFDAVRSYPRGVRHDIGAFPRERGNNCYLCQALKISGFSGADPGRNLEIDPTLAALYAEERSDFPAGELEESESDLDPGLTARWSITPNLTLNGTLNPDFSHVEADAAQLDINTRFALFYPEKRPFFLEGADFFDLPVNVVYTRTMADPDWGVKLSGKVGRGALALFSVEDSLTNLLFPGSQRSSSTSLGEGNQASAFRYRHDVGTSSTVGVIATDREGAGYFNRILGLDATMRFTSEDTLRLAYFGSRTRYDEETAAVWDQPADEFSGSALDLFYLHGTRRTEHYVHIQDFGSGFRADLGFVPQFGFSFLDLGTLRTWYHDAPDHWFNKIRAWVGYERTEDPDGRSLRSVAGTFLEYDGPSESNLFALLYLGTQSYNGVEYGHDTLEVSGSLQATDDVEVGLRLFYGDAIDYAGERPATRSRLSPSLGLFVGRHLRVELDHVWERLWIDDGRLYEAHLSELRTIYQLNRRTLLRLILQHSDDSFDLDLHAGPRNGHSRTLSSQLLFSYKINPQTALYVGYSDSYRGDPATLVQVDRALFLKLGYAWVM
jgi:hypothetical protein